VLKDPRDDRETPYELLGLAPNATAAEVHSALPRFMRNPRNLPKLGRAQEAVRRLRDPKDRAALDIWFYPFETPAAMANDSEPPLDVADLARIPAVAERELYSDLSGGDLLADARPFKFTEQPFADLGHYDGLGQLQLDPPFDR
jgi:hypothetical protein